MLTNTETLLESLKLEIEALKKLVLESTPKNLLTLRQLAKVMPTGYRSVSTIRKMSIDASPPILSFIQVKSGAPILFSEAQVMKDLMVYEKMGISRTR